MHKKRRTSWTDEQVEASLREIVGSIGSFPTTSELRQLGMNDLCCAIGRSGGLLGWSERLGIARKHSDSDTGWDGEKMFMELLSEQGIPAVRSNAVKAPYDILAADVLKVDMKAANYKEYPYGKNSACRGWFYRIGKDAQADLILLIQLDTRNFYGLPWWVCPTTNVTIARDGGKYAAYLNNWDLVQEMISTRANERQRLGMSLVA